MKVGIWEAQGISQSGIEYGTEGQISSNLIEIPMLISTYDLTFDFNQIEYQGHRC